MNTSVPLSPVQLLELELTLASAWGEPRFGEDAGRITLPAGSHGDTVELLDGEQTALARIVSAHIDHGGVVTAGTAESLRPFGHLSFQQLRVTSGSGRVRRAVVVTGTVPTPSDPRWSGAPDSVVVLDDGDRARLARAVATAREAGGTPYVMPAPDPAVRSADEWERAVRRAAVALLADEIEIWHTGRERGTGVVVLLSGLSGSGKSTVAKLLAETLRERDERRVTLLDGDEVRQMLSRGLGFSKEDRQLNVQRIGWVAALVAEHRGIAICAPIAPYRSMREEMRARVEAVGSFVLVHIATPLEVCEARDRKGLYAKARRGEIAEFTGISDPYEEPEDADVTVDTAQCTPEEAVARILRAIPAAHPAEGGVPG